MKRTKTGWLLVVLLLIQSSGFGQATAKYLVLLRDKANTPFSVARPTQFLSERSIQRRQKQNIAIQERDLPVNPTYVNQLKQAGATIWYSSRWLNAVLVEADNATIASVQKLPFVKELEFGRALNAPQSVTELPVRVNSVSKPTSPETATDDKPLDYGISESQITQLGVDKMHRKGFLGEGMLIALLDAGYRNADKVSFLKPVFDEKRVLATYDFVQKETSVYEDDDHGLEVLSLIAATADQQLYGTAYKASFILLRTEDAPTEKQLEEANWLFGAEYADSAGVDIISSSLGYTQFDNASTSYTYQNMDGKTALSSRAAQIATETGMVVVVAAGNEGGRDWHYISAPSDAASVLAIGAVTQTGEQTSFSSFGPSADGRVKPDLAARGQGNVVGKAIGKIGLQNGTSEATPLVAGLAAGFWQSHPRLTAAQVTSLLRQSGSQYGSPNDRLGYGIPDFERASALADIIDQPASVLAYPNPFSDLIPLQIVWKDMGANAPIEASLVDLTGRILWQKNYNSSGLAAFTLPNLGLSAGLYIMRLVAGDKKQSLMVLKQ